MNLAGIWILPLVDRDEAYYAEVSREMLQRDDFLVPHFNGQPWLEKPPLLYWCQTVSFRIFGENEFAVRFPSSLACALTSLVVFCFCRRLYNPTVALRAAMMFTLCAVMLYLGKAGMTDGIATLFTTLAFWAGWEMLDRTGTHRDLKRRVSWWAFYLSLSLVFLAKGPLCLLPVGGILIYCKWAHIPNFFHSMKLIRGLSGLGIWSQCEG